MQLPVDGDLLKNIGHLEDLVTGCLCCLEGTDGWIHVVLPPAFGLDPKSLSVMYTLAESRGVVWANHDLIDNDDKNLMHDVSMANMTEYQDPQMDEVCRLGLCLELLPVAKVVRSLPLSLATLELRLQLVSPLPANFIDDVWKSVVSHIGAVKLLSYLGHIFSLSLDFQTLMWQLVFTESIFPVSMNREHLQRGASTLHMFAELLPEIRPCAIPLPPLPAVQLVQAPAKPNALTPTTSNPDEDASAMNLNNPPDDSSNRPLPPTLMVVQAMHMPTLAPEVSMPKMLVPNFSMSDATEHLRAAICLLLGLKGLAEVVQACSGTPMDGDKSTPKAIASIGIMSSQHRCPTSHPSSKPSSHGDEQSGFNFLHSLSNSGSKSVVCSHLSGGEHSNSHHEPKRIRLEGHSGD